MLQFFEEFKAIFEYASGVTDDPPPRGQSWMRSPLWWGIWWAILILLIVAFSGQSSKFIYIDF
ncbi:MAG TPA: hypothetical protein VK335_27935 [Bryobacteraceae bacterium]|nr:hypothetical protein [Bryobacteraceae bacterium]